MHIQRPPMPDAQVLLLYQTFLFAWFKTLTGYVLLFMAEFTHHLTKKQRHFTLENICVNLNFPNVFIFKHLVT